MLAPFSLTPALDANGTPIRTAALMVYEAGTTTPAVLYRQSDYAAGTEHPNPIRVNGAGLLPAMFGAGAFKFRLLTGPVGGAIIWEADGVTLTDPPAADDGQGDNTGLMSTGQLAQFYGTGTRVGYVRMNGRSIGNAASSATERAAPDTAALYLSLWSEDDTLIVAGGRGQTAQQDFDAGKALSLPDARGRLLMSLDGMGGGSSGLLAGVTWNAGGSATRLGSYAGSATAALATGNMPSHAHPFSVSMAAAGAFSVDGTTDVDSPGHVHGIPLYSLGLTGGTFPVFLVTPPGTSATTAVPSNGRDPQHRHAFNVSQPAHNHALTYSMDAVGSGAAFSILPPVLLVTTYLKL